MIKIIPILLLFVCINSYAGTRKVLIPDGNGNIYVNNATTTYSLIPGDTLYLENGRNYQSIVLQVINGTQANPIIIYAEPGVVVGGNPDQTFALNRVYWVNMYNVSMKADRSAAANCLTINNTSHIGVYDCKFKYGAIGFQLKTNVSGGDPTTYYPITVIEDVRIFGCKSDSADGEAFYIGPTFAPAPTDSLHIQPPIIGLQMGNDTALNPGWDGIQIASCQQTTIENCYIYNYGTAGLSSQGYGLFFGGATTIRYAKNITVRKGTYSGLAIFGRAQMNIYNITLDSVSTIGAGDGAVFIDNRSDYGLKNPIQQIVMHDITLTGSGGGNRPFYNLNGSSGPPPTYKSDSGYLYRFVYDSTKWAQQPSFGDIRAIGGTKGAAIPIYQYKNYGRGIISKTLL